MPAILEKSTEMKEPDNRRIPLFSTWSRWYFFVLAVLVLLIVFFAWFTKFFS